ncbi:MAG: hypothetical protein KKA73_01660 [Chloroflexi bacterium]|nr:hypothetical protein [Chloroflexota bacterium]MBU1746371.1 hypothetical protein [Chloroflexota bacterium]
MTALRTRLTRRWKKAPAPAPAPDAPRPAALQIGERTLIDQIAPGALMESLDQFAFSHTEYGRVWFIEDFPPAMSRRGIETLYRFPAPIQISFFSHPIPAQDVSRRMRQEVTGRSAAQMHRAEQGQLADFVDEAAIQDTLAALHEVEIGGTPYFYLSLYIRLMAPTEELLARWSADLEDVFKRLGLRALRSVARQEKGLYATLPVAWNALGHVRNMTATAQAHLFPFSSRQYVMSGGLFYGLNRLDRSLVFLDDFELDNANAIIVGKQGSGKSVFLKHKIENALLYGARCYVVDVEGEYEWLCEDLGGMYLDLSHKGDRTINVLDIDPQDERPLLTGWEIFQGWLRVAVGTLTPREVNVASDAYMETMARAGIYPDDPATWANRPPLLADYYATLDTKHDAHSADLAARIRPYAIRAYAELFNAPTNIDVHNPLVVFGLGELTESRLLPIRLWQIMSFVWYHVLRELHPTYFIVDEAWHLLGRPDTAEDLAKMARRFRKKWAGLVLATQHAIDFARNEHALVIRDTSATQILFAQETQAVPLVAQLFGLNQVETGDLSRLRPGEALVLLDDEHIPVWLPVMQDRWDLFTTRASEVAAIQQARSK